MIGLSPPSPAEEENLIVIFLGFVLATFLYGLTFFQMYLYFSRYSNDCTRIKVLVGALFVLDTTSTGLASGIVYHYLIAMFYVSMDVIYATSSFCIQGLFSVIIPLIAHVFFAGRLYIVCGGPTTITSRSVRIVVLLCAFIALVFGLISVGQFFQQRQLSAFALPSMVVIAGISQGFAAVANIIICVASCWSLRPARYPDIRKPEGVLRNLIVNRGLGLVVIQLAYFGIFVASPGKPYWIAVQMVTPRIYANTVLGLLNSRQVRHGVGVNEEETFSDRHDSRNGGLPSILRFHQQSLKVQTQQSSSFSQQGESSRGSEIEEASKSYTDEQNLESIHSHCSA